jgi:SprT protein
MSAAADESLPRERRIGRNLPQAVPFDIKQGAKKSLRDWYRMSCARFGPRIGLPSISFDLRGASTVAQAWVGENHIQLNAGALVADEARFSAEVIPHELAHLLAYRIYGAEIAPHGDEWQKIMGALGVEANVTYDVEYETDSSGPYIYACHCGKHGISARRHNILWRSKGTKVLECQKCGEVLRFKEIVEQTAARLSEKEPTVKMLEFATQLANRCGVQLPVEARKYISACRAFIDEHKYLRSAMSGDYESTASAHGEQGDVAKSPTEAQLKFAQRIASQKKIDLPPEVSMNRTLLSRWIDRHK